MTDSREFDLYDILAVTHGLPADWPHYRAILEYISGAAVPEPVRCIGVKPACEEWLFEQHPQLREVPPVPRSLRTDAATDAAMDAWAEEQRTRLGMTMLPVRPLPPDRADFGSPLEQILDAAESVGKLDTVFIQDPGGREEAG